MGKLNYLNLACGAKIHKDWVNVDFASWDPSVIRCDLLNGINYPDNSFSAVYHSQFIEHLSKDKAIDFMNECYRVLKPGGVMRVVTPDLENITRNYLLWLERCNDDPSEINSANYDWMMLELFDQTIRNSYGGEMGKTLGKEKLINEQFILERTGLSGRNIRKIFSGEEKPPIYVLPNKNMKENIVAVFRRLRQSYLKIVIPKKEKKLLEKGRFRESGEIHYWLYDRFSLQRLLQQAGFKKITVKSPHESDIPNWKAYELDVKDGYVIDPASIFMEATK
jgi:predicted SAM-dependent methyltransferase